jgi:L-ascorbate metabolism protein UlaG (beta-lactamase superfamily)
MAEKAAGENPAALTWLGQAGFLIEWGGLKVVIDPYLSDSLALKYRGRRFPHNRMQPPPFNPGELTEADFVICTHGHSDHMDPGTLPGAAAASPGCRFICPEAEKLKALERGVPEGRFIGMDAGFGLCLGAGAGDAGEVKLTALASAHEELSVDEAGRHLYLGVVLDFAGFRLYHSGDCVPYPGLAEALGKLDIDAALLPVNGRDDYRRKNGIPGNFTAEEAAELCRTAGISTIVPHHFGMFDFNTADPAEAGRVLADSGLQYIMPVYGEKFVMGKTP